MRKKIPVPQGGIGYGGYGLIGEPTPKTASKPEEYTTARDDMAQIVAQVVSNTKGAIPESVDYDIADQLLPLIKIKFSN